MKDKLAIFDMDGTLFDTTQVNYYAYKEAFENYSLELDENYFFENCYGRYYRDFLSEMIDSEQLIEDIHRIKIDFYAKNIHKARKNTHLFRYIEKMREEYYIAIVTNASKKNTMEILKAYHCVDYFDLILTSEDILKVKPDPEGFLTAMSHFNMGPIDTVIFEDSTVGIEAAKATGSTVLAVEKF